MTELGKRSRVAWTLWESSRPLTKRGGELTVAVADQGRLSSIKASRREELLRQVLIDVVRVDLRIVPVLAPQERSPDQFAGAASADDPDLAEEDVNGVDLVMRELGAVRIGEIGEA